MSACAPRKTRDAEQRLRLGLDLADEAGRTASLMTCTLRRGDHFGRAIESWGAFVKATREGRRGDARRIDAVRVIEFGRARGGRHLAHLHGVILHGGVSARELAERARRAGFGFVDVRLVGPAAADRAGVSGYMTKSLFQTAVDLRRGMGTRTAPIRFGNSWPSLVVGG